MLDKEKQFHILNVFPNGLLSLSSELIYKLNKVKVYIFNGKFRCKYFEYMFKSVRKRKYNILKRSWHVVCIPLKKKCQNIATMRVKFTCIAKNGLFE